MTPQQRTRYARQLLLPEIGEQGQRGLCDTQALLPRDADPGAAGVAAEYLERAGLRVRAGSDPAEATPDAVRVPVASRPEVARWAGDEALEEAAAALAGAFAAVEAIKATVGTGEAGTLPEHLSLAGEREPETT